MTSSRLPLTLPPLENGDKLTRREFEQRYTAMPHIKKAKLSEGFVYMASPLHAKAHGKPHAQIIGWLVAYEAATPGVEVLDNPTVRLDNDNEVQPDALCELKQMDNLPLGRMITLRAHQNLLLRLRCDPAAL